MSHFDITPYTHIMDVPEMVINADSAWLEHIPFAFFLVSILKPKSFVELGVQAGESYNAFCQMILTLNTNTTCYAVDTWRGDKHTGFYGKHIYDRLVQHQKEKGYTQFSNFLRMTFNKALHRFPEKSIDLLHIDGLHTYDAVKGDFNNWLPKMSECGVVILHDTQVRERDFGVYKLWEEISTDFPSFEFKHGCGLGILAVGNQAAPEFLNFLEQANRDPFFQNLFYKLGACIKYDIECQRYQRMESKSSAIAEKLGKYPFLVRILSTAYHVLTKLHRFSTGKRQNIQ